MSTLLENVSQAQHDDPLVQRGQEFYDQELRKILEPAHVGRFVAIEPDTGRYFLGDTGTAALVEAHDALPEHAFYLIRIGYEAAHTLHGYE